MIFVTNYQPSGLLASQLRYIIKASAEVLHQTSFECMLLVFFFQIKHKKNLMATNQHYRHIKEWSSWNVAGIIQIKNFHSSYARKKSFVKIEYLPFLSKFCHFCCDFCPITNRYIHFDKNIFQFQFRYFFQ